MVFSFQIVIRLKPELVTQLMWRMTKAIGTAIGVRVLQSFQMVFYANCAHAKLVRSSESENRQLSCMQFVHCSVGYYLGH